MKNRPAISLSLSLIPCLATLVALLILSSPARAQSSTRYVATTGTDSGACTNPNNPCRTVQYAVDQASSDSGDVIKVATGVYNDVNNYGGSDQVVYIDKTITIRGGYTINNWTVSDPKANPTTLDARQRGRVIYVTKAGTSPTIEGLRITGGNATGTRGGGVFVTDAFLTLRNNTVFANTAQRGGGVYVGYTGAMLKGNTVISNTAEWWGGGLCLDSCSATVEGGAIISNTASQSGGGVFAELGYPCPTIRDVTIASNVANKGGGLGLGLCDSTVSNTVIAENRAQTTGGGLYIWGAEPRMQHLTIARNESGDGSGVTLKDVQYLHYLLYSNLHLTNTILVSHTVGISVTEGNTATLENTLWHGNTTDWHGAGTINHSNDHTGDPAFRNPGGGNYHIAEHSAAKDAGSNAGVTTDIDGQPRPYGDGYDIGADEYWPPCVLTKCTYLPLILRNAP